MLFFTSCKNEGEKSSCQTCQLFLKLIFLPLLNVFYLCDDEVYIFEPFKPEWKNMNFVINLCSITGYLQYKKLKINNGLFSWQSDKKEIFKYCIELNLECKSSGIWSSSKSVISEFHCPFPPQKHCCLAQEITS
jgi:hypothetical protein